MNRPHVESFESFEDMQDYLSKANAQAATRIAPFQREVGKGDHWMRVVELGQLVLIAGRVHDAADDMASAYYLSTDFVGEAARLRPHFEATGVPLDEPLTWERSLVVAGAAGVHANEEWEARAEIEQGHHEDYLFGAAYSVIEPDGELGSTHRSEVIPITEPQFADLKLMDWRLEDVIRSLEWVRDVVEDAETKMREHLGA